MSRRSSRVVVALAAAAALTLSIVMSEPDQAAAQPTRTVGTTPPDGPFALDGAAASVYRLPADVQKSWSAQYADGSRQTRYQQVVRGAKVLNGQLTVLRDNTGDVSSVIGAHYDNVLPTNRVRLSGADARAVAVDKVGVAGKRFVDLRIDPRDGRFFYAVETRRDAHRPTLWVDATDGTVVNRYDAITEGSGEGVKGDTKTIDTTQSGGRYQLVSADRRQLTYDAQNQTTHPGVMMTDADDVWDFKVALNPSPSQPPGVDAHYYANLIDDFYADTFSRDSIDDAGMPIISTVHYDAGYCNAFWNGEQMTYGDGDGSNCKALSGGLDVIGHELTHGVTEFTSGLIYENESGALNEAFSDMMGNTSEFYADQRGLDPAAQPDWLIGEDVIPAGLYGGANPGFRNMADPRDDGDPDHYSERYTGTSDNGGVHTNSGIANHAYVLAVQGGRNAGCGTSVSGHTHAADCDVRVTGIGLARAQQVFYKGFTSLTEYANMCDARNATLAVSRGNRKSIAAAWDAVGVHSGCTPAVPPPPPCVGSANAQIPFESPHPYGNNGDCTWTFDNGRPGFAFHFDQLETEAGYDYVYVYDAAGNQLAKYDGPHPLGQTSPCIGTSVGSVRLVTDMAVVDQGFHVDAAPAC